jgi:hypothetical protein
MENNKPMLIVGGIIVLSISIIGLSTAITTKSEHEKRMELIKEKETLFDLEKKVNFEKAIYDCNKITDSLNVIINKELVNGN